MHGRCARVKRTKKRPAGLAICWLWTRRFLNLRHGDLLLQIFLTQVVAGTDQPQRRVNHEKRQHPDEQQVHKQAHEVECRIQLADVRVGVGLVLHETDVGARMALAAIATRLAGSLAMRIRCRPDIVRPVAVPAARRLHVAAQHPELGVKGVAIGAELVLVTGPADRGRLHAERCRGGLLMACAVWQSEHTGAPILPACDRLAVDPSK